MFKKWTKSIDEDGAKLCSKNLVICSCITGVSHNGPCASKVRLCSRRSHREVCYKRVAFENFIKLEPTHIIPVPALFVDAKN